MIYLKQIVFSNLKQRKLLKTAFTKQHLRNKQKSADNVTSWKIKEIVILRMK